MNELLFKELETSIKQAGQYDLLIEAKDEIIKLINGRKDDNNLSQYNSIYIKGLEAAKQIIKDIVIENYKVTRIEVLDKPSKPIIFKPEKEWCMCTELSLATKDMDATCQQCGGKDAYCGSKKRPEDKQKTWKFKGK